MGPPAGGRARKKKEAESQIGNVAVAVFEGRSRVPILSMRRGRRLAAKKRSLRGNRAGRDGKKRKKAVVSSEDLPDAEPDSFKS